MDSGSSAAAGTLAAGPLVGLCTMPPMRDALESARSISADFQMRMVAVSPRPPTSPPPGIAVACMMFSTTRAIAPRSSPCVVDLRHGFHRGL